MAWNLMIEHLKSAVGIVDITMAVLLAALMIFLCIKFKFGKFSIVITSILLIFLILAAVFNFTIAEGIILVMTIAVTFSLCFAHIGTIRSKVASITTSKGSKKVGVKKIVDHEALYREVYEAVAACSRQKIGALITFEKHDDLSNLTKNGTVINAPVTHELIMTIFYPGTRLHDGAIIIKDNIIYAASVYYTPTTKALTGKYGSRHRAAIGISQISDSVTVVVSEETGRISIAQHGEIEPVGLDEFIDTLAERINQGEE